MDLDVNSLIHVELRRLRGGIAVRVRMQREVEDFFKHWGLPESRENVLVYGRHWQPLQEGSQLPLLWYFPRPVGTLSGSYDLWRPGQEILGDDEIPINLSFLRLEGTSSGDGVGFFVDTLISQKKVIETANQINVGLNHFQVDFLQPIQFDVDVITKPSGTGK